MAFSPPHPSTPRPGPLPPGSLWNVPSSPDTSGAAGNHGSQHLLLIQVCPSVDGFMNLPPPPRDNREYSRSVTLLSQAHLFSPGQEAPFRLGLHWHAVTVGVCESPGHPAAPPASRFQDAPVKDEPAVTVPRVCSPGVEAARLTHAMTLERTQGELQGTHAGSPAGHSQPSPHDVDPTPRHAAASDQERCSGTIDPSTRLHT